MKITRLVLALTAFYFALHLFINSTFAQVSPPRSYFQLAMSEAENDNFEQAIEHLKSQIREDSTFTEAFIRMAEFFRYSGNPQLGAAYFESAIARAPQNPNLRLGLTLITKFLGDDQRAFEHSRLALELGAAAPEAIELLVEAALHSHQTDALQTVFRRLKKNPAQAPLADLGFAYLKFRTDNLNSARTTLRNLLNKQREPAALTLLGEVYLRSKEFPAAISSCQEALKLNSAHAPRRNIRVLRNLGTAYLMSAKPDSAEQYLSQALILAQKIGDLKEQLEICTALTFLSRQQQRYSRLIDSGWRAIELAKRLHENHRLLELYNEIAGGYEKMGDRQRAVKNYLYSAQAAGQFGDHSQAARAFNQAGRLLKELLRWQQAQYYLDRSIEIAEQAGAEEIKYSALKNLADLHQLRGDLESAKEKYSRVLRFAQDANHHNLAQTCLLKLANIHLRAGMDLNAASNYLVLADAAAKQSLNLENAANIRWLQGRLALLHRDFEKAETYFLDAIQLGREIGSPVSVLAGNAGLISCYLSVNFLDLAAARADTALNFLDAISLLYLDDPNAEFFDLKNDLIIPAITAFSQTRQSSKIYLACETYKAYHHIRNIAPIKHLIDPQLPDSVRWKLDNLDNEIHTKWLELWNLWRSDQHDNLYLVAEIKRDIRFLENQRLQTRRQLAEQHPEFYSLIQPTPEPLAALQRRLGELNSVFVHYLVGDKTTDLIAVRADTVVHERVNYGEEYLENLIKQLNPRFSDAAIGNGAAKADFRLDLAGQLYGVIVEPVKKHIPQNYSLILSPDEILHRLPWECLVVNPKDLADKSDYNKAHFLLQDFSMVYAPYARFLDWNYPHRTHKQKSLLALSTPANNHHSAGNGASAFNDEARQIARLVGNSDVFETQRSTRERFLSQAASYKAIHLTAPAVVEDGAALYSKFYVMDSSGRLDSLESRELFDLKLTANFVVASNLTLFRDSDSENEGSGMSGLLHAFNYAGVSGLVASQWPTNDPARIALFLNFYSHLKDGLQTSEALRQAKLKMLAAGDSNPTQWANLVYYGLPTRVQFESNNLRWIIGVTFLGVVILALMVVRYYFLGAGKKS